MNSASPSPMRGADAGKATTSVSPPLTSNTAASPPPPLRDASQQSYDVARPLDDSLSPLLLNRDGHGNRASMLSTSSTIFDAIATSQKRRQAVVNKKKKNGDNATRRSSATRSANTDPNTMLQALELKTAWGGAATEGVEPLVSAIVGYAFRSAEDALLDLGTASDGGYRSALSTNDSASSFSFSFSAQHTSPMCLCGLVVTSTSVHVVDFGGPSKGRRRRRASRKAEDDDAFPSSNSDDDQIVVYSESPAAVSGAPNLGGDDVILGSDFQSSPSPPRNIRRKGQIANNKTKNRDTMTFNDSDDDPPPPPSSSSDSGGDDDGDDDDSKRASPSPSSPKRQRKQRNQNLPLLPSVNIIASVPIEYVSSIAVFGNSEEDLKAVRRAMTTLSPSSPSAQQEKMDEEASDPFVAVEIQSVNLDLFNAMVEQRRKARSLVASEFTSRSSSSSSSSSNDDSDSSSNSSSSPPPPPSSSSSSEDESPRHTSSPSSSPLSSHQARSLRDFLLCFVPIAATVVDNPPIGEVLLELCELAPSARLTFDVLDTKTVMKRRAAVEEKRREDEAAALRAHTLSPLAFPSPSPGGDKRRSPSNHQPSAAALVVEEHSPLGLRNFRFDPASGKYKRVADFNMRSASPLSLSSVGGGGGAEAKSLNLSLSESSSPLGLRSSKGFFNTYQKILVGNATENNASNPINNGTDDSADSVSAFIKGLTGGGVKPNSAFTPAANSLSPSAAAAAAISPAARAGGGGAGILASFHGGQTHALVMQTIKDVGTFRTNVASQEGSMVGSLEGAGAAGVADSDIDLETNYARRSTSNEEAVQLKKELHTLACAGMLFSLQIEEQTARTHVSDAEASRRLLITAACHTQGSKLMCARLSNEMNAVKQTHTSLAVLSTDPSTIPRTCGVLPVSGPVAVSADGVTPLLSITTLPSANATKSFEPQLVNTGVLKKPLNDEVVALITQHEKSARQRMNKYFTQTSVELTNRARDIEWTAFTAAHKGQLTKIHADLAASRKQIAQLTMAAAKANEKNKSLAEELATIAGREEAVLEKARRREEALHAELQIERQRNASLLEQLKSNGIDPLPAGSNVGIGGGDSLNVSPAQDGRRRNFSIFQ